MDRSFSFSSSEALLVSVVRLVLALFTFDEIPTGV
jgi:hypothetical protein